MLDVPAAPVPPAPGNASAVLAPGTKIRKLEDGFFSISGAAVDAAGKLYFADRWRQRIYGWSAAEGLRRARSSPGSGESGVRPVGNLLVLSSAGAQSTVYQFPSGHIWGADDRNYAARNEAPPGGRGRSCR